jgi:hypothetical protein
MDEAKMSGITNIGTGEEIIKLGENVDSSRKDLMALLGVLKSFQDWGAEHYTIVASKKVGNPKVLYTGIFSTLDLVDMHDMVPQVLFHAAKISTMQQEELKSIMKKGLL